MYFCDTSKNIEAIRLESCARKLVILLRQEDKYCSSRPRRGLSYLSHGIPVPLVRIC